MNEIKKITGLVPSFILIRETYDWRFNSVYDLIGYINENIALCDECGLNDPPVTLNEIISLILLTQTQSFVVRDCFEIKIELTLGSFWG